MKAAFPAACRRGYTLAEVMMSLAIGSVVCATTLTGVVFLQKSYAATEQYALSMADQMRVLDSISMDMRRATAVSVNNVNQTLTITLPGYFSYATGDTTHQSPLPVLPTIATNLGHAVYTPGTGAAVPSVVYRFDGPSGQLQRMESFTDGTSTAWLPVASQVSGFPSITQDATNSQKYTISVNFTPLFQTLDTPDTNVITLTTTVYLRNS